MDGIREQSTSWQQRLSGDSLDAEPVPGLAEWLDMEDWRAGWLPLPDPYVGIEQLQAIYQRVMRHGYAAYLRGERAMPDFFSCNRSFAAMWQEGYASARMDTELMAFPGSPGAGECHPIEC